MHTRLVFTIETFLNYSSLSGPLTCCEGGSKKRESAVVHNDSNSPGKKYPVFFTWKIINGIIVLLDNIICRFLPCQWVLKAAHISISSVIISFLTALIYSYTCTLVSSFSLSISSWFVFGKDQRWLISANHVLIIINILFSSMPKRIENELYKFWCSQY